MEKKWYVQLFELLSPKIIPDIIAKISKQQLFFLCGALLFLLILPLFVLDMKNPIHNILFIIAFLVILLVFIDLVYGRSYGKQKSKNKNDNY
jgi:hypothetical protein